MDYATRISYLAGLSMRSTTGLGRVLMVDQDRSDVYVDALTYFKIMHGGRLPFESRYSAGAIAVERERRTKAKEQPMLCEPCWRATPCDCKPGSCRCSCGDCLRDMPDCVQEEWRV